MRQHLLTVLALCIVHTFALGQENSFPAESLYIHTNTDTYLTGETVLYKVYCFDNTSSSVSKISKIAYIEIFDHKGISVSRNKIELVNGIGSNEIFITTKYKTGNYKLVGYTRWMQNNAARSNYFEKDFTIINPFEPFQNKEKQSTVKMGENLQQKVQNKILAVTLNKSKFSTREKIKLEIEKINRTHFTGDLSLSIRKVDSLHFNAPESNAAKPNTFVDVVSYLPEVRGELVTGKITTENATKNIHNIDVALSFTGAKFDLKIYKTNAKGEFSFILDRNITNSEAFIQVLDDDDDDYKISMDQPTQTSLSTKNNEEALFIDPKFINQIEERLVSCQILNSFSNPIEAKSNDNFVPFYNPNQTDYILDDFKRFPSFKETIIEIIPSVYFKQKNDRYSLHIRDYVSDGDSYGKALVLIDGLMIQNLNDLFNYNTKNIFKISVINKPYVYGSRLFSGIISIITFDKKYSLIPKEVTPISIERYRDASTFTAPDYAVTSSDRIPDYRYQLAWHPFLKIEADKTSIEYYTSDVKGIFEITLEGFADDGQHVLTKSYFSVE